MYANLGSHSALLRSYYRLCAHKLLIVVFREPGGDRTELGPPTYKACSQPVSYLTSPKSMKLL